MARLRFAFLAAASLQVCAAQAADSRSITIDGIAAYNGGDYSSAYRLLKSAADMGDSDAEVNLGYMYARGQVVPADQAEAMRLYRSSAKQGNSEGMNAIAYKYTWGSGVAVDMKEAVRWYCEAIAQGDPRAMTNLGLLHATGRGVTYNMDEARSLWRQAASYGHANAMFDLGSTLLGDLMKSGGQNEGKTWIIRAAKLGQPAAIRWLQSNGYLGDLPAPVDTTGMMALAPPKNARGDAEECAIS